MNEGAFNVMNKLSCHACNGVYRDELGKFIERCIIMKLFNYSPLCNEHYHTQKRGANLWLALNSGDSVTNKLS